MSETVEGQGVHVEKEEDTDKGKLLKAADEEVVVAQPSTSAQAPPPGKSFVIYLNPLCDYFLGSFINFSVSL